LSHGAAKNQILTVFFPTNILFVNCLPTFTNW